MFVKGVPLIARTGSPWRDPREAFGEWNSVFRRFSRWSIKGVWWQIFEAMSDDPDFEYLIVDSTIVRAHQHAAGAKKRGSDDQAIGRSRVGLSTKMHMAVRGLGCPVRFTLTSGQKGDAPQAALIEGLPAEVVMADTAITRITCAGPSQPRAVIPNNPSCALKYTLDKHLLCPAPCRRMLPLRTQTVPAPRHPLRQNRPKLPSRRYARCHRPMDATSVHTA
ncbi:hypothetical protein ACVW1C_005992 [Bradyrhizobium sp. USDA 4011]